MPETWNLGFVGKAVQPVLSIKLTVGEVRRELQKLAELADGYVNSPYSSLRMSL